MRPVAITAPTLALPARCRILLLTIQTSVFTAVLANTMPTRTLAARNCTQTLLAISTYLFHPPATPRIYGPRTKTTRASGNPMDLLDIGTAALLQFYRSRGLPRAPKEILVKGWRYIYPRIMRKLR